MVDVKISGLTELTDRLGRLVSAYPDTAGDVLKANAKDFRKELVANMKAAAKSNRQSKKSLRKAGSYEIFPVYGYGAAQEVSISAKGPHFHLFEHGHNQTDWTGKKTIGFVEGRHVMQDTVESYRRKYPAIVEKSIDRILKAEGLI